MMIIFEMKDGLRTTGELKGCIKSKFWILEFGFVEFGIWDLGY